MQFFLAVILIFALVSCESAPTTSDDGQTAESREESSESSTDESASSATGHGKPKSECFDTCMENNQMRSVPIEQIEDDCRAQCNQDGALDGSTQ